MGQTRIEWTESVWNPVIGCSKVSPGCDHCYAATLARRFGWTTEPWTAPHAAQNVQCHPERLDQPLHWRRPRNIFVNSMSDLFHDRVPDSFLDAVFAVMSGSLRHTYQILTKRPRRMHAYLTDPATPERIVRRAWHNAGVDAHPASLHDLRVLLNFSWPLPHVWLGVSVEDQRRANERIPVLLQTPAALRFLSCEPLLGPVDLTALPYPVPGGGTVAMNAWQRPSVLAPQIDWVIAGAESGPGARPMDDDWVRTLRDQCQNAGIPFFFKQRCHQGRKESHPLLDGQLWEEFPTKS